MGKRSTANAWLSTLRGLLPAAGLYPAGVLTLSYFEGINVPCGESAGCELVSKSAIAAPGGIPIALVGSLAYLALVICGYAGLGRSSAAPVFRSIGYVLSGVGALVSVGLTIYSVRVIGATCRWCLASTIIFCLTLILYSVSASMSQPISDLATRLGRFLVVWCAFGCGTAIIAATHFMQNDPPAINARVLGNTKLEDLIPDRAPSLGDKHGDFIVVFFGDLQCRTCKEALPKIAKEVEATPRTRLVYRYFPLSFHDFAKEAAIAAESSRKTVGFWPFVWKLYSNPDYLNHDWLRKTERWAKLEDKIVGDGFVDDAAKQQVESDHTFGTHLGVKGTPTILIIEGKKVTALSYKVALDRIRERRKLQANAFKL